MLEGKNSITVNNGNVGIAGSAYGSAHTDCIIRGDGSINLKVEGTTAHAYGMYIFGNIHIDGGTIKVNCSTTNIYSSCGISAVDSLVEISGGNVEVSVEKHGDTDSAIDGGGDTLIGIKLSNGVIVKEPAYYKIGKYVSHGYYSLLDNNGDPICSVKIGFPDEAVEASSSSCSHDYQWTVEKEPTETEDCEAAYKCTKCGHISARQPLTAYQYYVLESTNKIKNAKAGSTVTISSKHWNSFPKSFFEQVAKRRDITVNIQFPYAQKMYEITISPTQTIDTSNDKAKYYGPKYMIGIYKGTEVTAK